MKRLSGILDRIPAAYEHAAILFLAVFGYTVCAAILAAHRASVLWESWTVWQSALDAATVTAAGMLLLTFTTLTRRYGVGSDQDPGNVGADPGDQP